MAVQVLHQAGHRRGEVLPRPDLRLVQDLQPGVHVGPAPVGGQVVLDALRQPPHGVVEGLRAAGDVQPHHLSTRVGEVRGLGGGAVADPQFDRDRQARGEVPGQLYPVQFVYGGLVRRGGRGIVGLPGRVGAQHQACRECVAVPGAYRAFQFLDDGPAVAGAGDLGQRHVHVHDRGAARDRWDRQRHRVELMLCGVPGGLAGGPGLVEHPDGVGVRPRGDVAGPELLARGLGLPAQVRQLRTDPVEVRSGVPEVAGGFLQHRAGLVQFPPRLVKLRLGGGPPWLVLAGGKVVDRLPGRRLPFL
ncbi:hypothetical protein C5N14_29315 [Micromonospora sp. MW-13]|nr:hypothetical protein C5N14_29315 [Micromonospora sp. MW-13]